MGVRAEQRDRTRRELVAQARRLFAGRGFTDVGLAEVTAAAGVTKGALYHQFASKEELLEAVLSEALAEVAGAVAAAAGVHDDPWEQLVAGCRAFLEASTDPSVARVALVDGPAVLGWDRWRALDAATSERHLAEALAAVLPDPVAPVTALLSGAMNSAALWVVGTPGAAVDDVWPGLQRMLAGLRPT